MPLSCIFPSLFLFLQTRNFSKERTIFNISTFQNPHCSIHLSVCCSPFFWICSQQGHQSHHCYKIQKGSFHSISVNFSPYLFCFWWKQYMLLVFCCCWKKLQTYRKVAGVKRRIALPILGPYASKLLTWCFIASKYFDVSILQTRIFSYITARQP